MIEEKLYKIIGKDGCEAMFSVSLTGSLNIKFLGSFCEMRAPVEKLSFTDDSKMAVKNATEIMYSEGTPSKVLWRVTISRTDADELRGLIESASSGLGKLLKR
ncbi:hypothetical protein [Teredinibacter turnerae]|uniref:hypothetical protein n=1 Tax=Teredinibacter turnerae TaxID=2426 RepID=UPI00048CE108|nr:hypothetical protein [Teredinibacter turnerae]